MSDVHALMHRYVVMTAAKLAIEGVRCAAWSLISRQKEMIRRKRGAENILSVYPVELALNYFIVRSMIALFLSRITFDRCFFQS